MSKPKLITIIGATGTGKSDLAVSLARRFNGEVINADAMQLYEGLPIITNKISEQEQHGVPHHLLGCIGLDQRPWAVNVFVKSALRAIDEVHGRGRLPIVVGGTNYYIQSLLFRDTLAHQTTDDVKTKEVSGGEGADAESRAVWPILSASTAEILAKLAEVDPVMARRWHPNDRRKIQRSLEIYLQTGRRASDIYAEQQQRSRDLTGTSFSVEEGADSSASVLNGDLAINAASNSDTLRMPTLVLWIHADNKVLYPRLDARVDKMLEAGLLDEVRRLSSYAKNRPSVDYGSGIWVSIGYKEFLPYLAHIESVHTEAASGVSTATRDQSVMHGDKTTEKLYREAVEATKAGTRQYAKRQVRWIRIKLLNALAAAGGDVATRIYALDGADPSSFQTDVVERAVALVENFLGGGGGAMPEHEAFEEPLLRPRGEDMRVKVGVWERKECGVCGVVATTESDWSHHVRSRRHKKLAAKTKSAGGEVQDRHEGHEE